MNLSKLSLFQLILGIKGITQTNIYVVFKVNNRNTRKGLEYVSKITIKTSERRLVFILTLKIFFTLSSVFIVDFEQVDVSRYSRKSFSS